MANTQVERNIQPFGYSEMYEWAHTPIEQKYGLFVQFSSNDPDKIEPSHEYDPVIAGVSTICAVAESDNPSEWKNKWACNEVGDIFMEKETLAVGNKVYDQHLEMAYIQTRPWDHYIKIKNKEFDDSLKYIPRTSRKEWTRVTIVGKAIVIDDGSCTPGQFCRPYSGIDMLKAGHAVPAEPDYNGSKYYVLDRVTDKSITIVMK